MANSKQSDDSTKAPGIMEYYHNVSTNEKAIVFLREYDILHNSMFCDYCKGIMKIKRSVKLNDGEIFMCTTCNITKTIREGSMFKVFKFFSLTLTDNFFVRPYKYTIIFI